MLPALLPGIPAARRAVARARVFLCAAVKADATPASRRCYAPPALGAIHRSTSLLRCRGALARDFPPEHAITLCPGCPSAWSLPAAYLPAFRPQPPALERSASCRRRRGARQARILFYRRRHGVFAAGVCFMPASRFAEAARRSVRVAQRRARGRCTADTSATQRR